MLYITSQNFSNRDAVAYYFPLCKRDEVPYVCNREKSSSFPTLDFFVSYCFRLTRVRLLDKSWERAIIVLPNCQENHSSFYLCPLLLFSRLISDDGMQISVISFWNRVSSNRDRIYSSLWDTCIHESLVKTVGNVVLVGFYSDGARISESWTQYATSLRIRFSNLHSHNERWFTIGMAPNLLAILTSLPDERRRQFKMQLYQRYIFLLFGPLISVSCSVTAVNGVTLFSFMAIVVVDQPEGRRLCVSKVEILTWTALYVLFSTELDMSYAVSLMVSRTCPLPTTNNGH